MDVVAKGEGFSVKLRGKEVVAPVLPMLEHWLPQSNLDLLLPPLDVGVFFCYKKPEDENLFSFSNMVSVLKKAMAQALVSYYAFSGEVVHNTLGEPEVLCNNRGVDFIEAYADVELRQLNLYNPDESIEGKLVPKKKQGVLSVQATELKCGGIVVACTFDHRVADAFSANMFLVTWVELAQSKPTLSYHPSFRRSLLNPRHPGHYDPSIDNLYTPISALPPPKPKDLLTSAGDQLLSRIYYIEASQLSRLQSLASDGGEKRTKLEAFSAFVWKVVAASNKNGNNKNCRLGIVVDGRSQLRGGDSSEKAETMSAYFGNVLSIPYGGKRIVDLEENSLSWVANAVHECLEVAKRKEHFLELIDWVEAHRPEPAMTKVYIASEDGGPAVVVSSGQRFPVAELEFGWGKPVFGSYHFPWGGETGYVMPMPSPVGNGDWVVYMHMLRGQLEIIESKAAHLFRPLTSDYLSTHQ